MVTLVTFKSATNMLVSVLQMFFMITIFTFRQIVWQNTQIMFFYSSEI